MKDKNTPIIVANTEWDLPQNIITYVNEERMINGLIDMIKPLTPEESVGYAEVVAYLMPELQKRVLSSRVSKIYLYCVTQLMKRHKIEVPEDIATNELTDYELKELNNLKKWLYQSRGGKEKNPIIDAIKEVFKDDKKYPRDIKLNQAPFLQAGLNSK
jgi:hypothetical protein